MHAAATCSRFDGRSLGREDQSRDWFDGALDGPGEIDGPGDLEGPVEVDGSRPDIISDPEFPCPFVFRKRSKDRCFGEEGRSHTNYKRMIMLQCVYVG
jgi:hypothetical protein